MLPKTGTDPLPLAFEANVLLRFPDEWDRPYFPCSQGKFHVHCTVDATLHYHSVSNMDGKFDWNKFFLSLQGLHVHNERKTLKLPVVLIEQY
jgi:hypothetical protein